MSNEPVIDGRIAESVDAPQGLRVEGNDGQVVNSHIRAALGENASLALDPETDDSLDCLNAFSSWSRAI